MCANLPWLVLCGGSSTSVQTESRTGLKQGIKGIVQCMSRQGLRVRICGPVSLEEGSGGMYGTELLAYIRMIRGRILATQARIRLHLLRVSVLVSSWV